MPRLNPVDRWFFSMDGGDTPSQVAVMVTFKLPDGASEDYLRRLVADMRETRTFAPPFNYRMKPRPLRRLAPALETIPDEEIDLDYHVRHSALPRPGGERDLGVLVSRLFSRPLDKSKPLWEVHVIEGLENDRFAWFFKVHHGVMDGVGGMTRFAQMLTTDPDQEELTPIWSLQPERRPRVSEPDGPGAGDGVPGKDLIGAAREAAQTAGALGKLAMSSAREARNPGNPAIAAAYGAPESILNSRIGQQRRFATQSYELERVKAVARAHGVTVNDVFLALCAGSLRRYLSELGELPDGSVTAGVPVSVRPAGDLSESNAISSILVKLRTDIADPAERIKAISESSRLAKENLQSMPKGAIELSGVLGMAPLAIQQLTGLAGRSAAPFNLLISSVPGPTEPLYMRGAAIEGLYPLSIVSHGQALNISGGSISGRFNIGIVGCRDTLPSLQKLAVYCGEALEELEAALPAEAEPAGATSR